MPKKRARIMVVTGPGKGKTTSAMGVVLRALACGERVLLVRFTKVRPSGEVSILRHFSGLDVIMGERGFTPPPGDPDYPSHVAAARKLFEEACRLSEKYDLVVLDEICGVTSRGMLSEAEVVAFLHTLRPDMTAILTGRGAGLELIAAADTVSEILDVKHAYRRGITAEEGVEF